MKRISLIAAAFCMLTLTSCSESKTEAPVGDRALFQVSGNVQSIKMEAQDQNNEFMFLSDNPEFTGDGLFFVSGTAYKDTLIDGEKALIFDEEGDSYVCCTYDDNGRLVCATWWEWAIGAIEYDEAGRVVKYTAYGMEDHESVHTFILKYKEGTCPYEVSIVVRNIEYAETESDTDREVFTETKYIYEVTAKDQNGNWTERRRDDGVVEKRTIKYFAD